MISVSLTTSPRSRAFSSSSDKTPSEQSSSSYSSPRSGRSSRPSCVSSNSCLLSGGYTRPIANPPTQVSQHPHSSHSPEWIESRAILRRKLERKGHNPFSAPADATQASSRLRKNIIASCRITLAPFVLGLCITNLQGESHADDCRESTSVKTRALARPRPQRSRHIVSAVRRRDQAGALACCHGNDGQ